jgi:hypothetical protein
MRVWWPGGGDDIRADHQVGPGGCGMRMARWSSLLVALVVSVAALGCGSAVEQGGGDDPTQQSNEAATDDGGRQSNGAPGLPEGQPGGAPGAPGDGGGQAQAIEAPLEIPDIQQVGAPISSAKPQIEIQFKEEVCKHREPCVNLQVRPADVDPDHCNFTRTDPKKGTKIKRGATVYLVCTPEEGYGGGGQSTNSTGSTESTQSQPTETTAAPEDGQPPSSS